MKALRQGKAKLIIIASNTPVRSPLLSVARPLRRLCPPSHPPRMFNLSP